MIDNMCMGYVLTSLVSARSKSTNKGGAAHDAASPPLCLPLPPTPWVESATCQTQPAD